MEGEDKTASKKPYKSSGRNMLCGVCGDKALGYNFSAITCESCKAFFRRNALVSKEFKCPFREQCEITVITRRFCQKCRLEKCLSIGMVKDYIMSDEDKAQKRQKIAENKAKRRNNFNVSEDEVSSSKFIKREETDTISTKTNRQSATDDVDDNQIDSPAIENAPIENNQAVSVIKNNNLSDSHVENTSADVNHYNVIPKKQCNYSEFEASGENMPTMHPQPNLAFNPHISNIINHVNGVASNGVLNMNADKDHDNSMIRSMLTTSPPNDDASKLFAALTSNQMNNPPMCESSPAQNSHEYQEQTDIAWDVLQDVERVELEPKSMKLILCEAIKLEFGAYSSLPHINNSNHELNDAERARLNELIVANKALLAPLDDYMTTLVSEDCGFKPSQGQNDPMLLGIINLTAVAIRRLIKMAKKINGFKTMCEADQVALLKGGCTEMMILRSTMTYDCARDTWKVPHSQESLSSIKAEVLKLAKGNIYEEHDKFVRTFDAKWRTDENIILIMSAIVLFTPNRPRVVHSDAIKLEQISYYYLLRQYLQSIYQGCEAKSAFLKLIQKIKELRKLAEEVIGVYLDVNPSHVEPLLIEIFDLKQQQ